MKSYESVLAEYQLRTLVPAIALVLKYENARTKQVFSPEQLVNSIERHFSSRPSTDSVIAAMKEGPTYTLWRILGSDNPTPHIEVLPNAINLYVEALRHVPDSELVALETVGKSHFSESLESVVGKARKDFEYNKRNDRDSVGDAGFDRLRDGINYMHGLNQYRAKGKSAFSREVDNQINWGKWGALAGLAALPLAIILWWFTK